MKKIIAILFVFILSTMLYACGGKEKISNKEISEKIQTYLDAKSYETSLHVRMVTEEMELTINPLLTVSMYTDDQDQTVTKLHYHNKIMEGAGLNAFEMIYDERDEKIYLNDTSSWYQGSFSELEELFGSDFDLGEIDSESAADIEFVTETILESIKNYKSATFVELRTEQGRNLVQYELEYNVYDVLKDIFDHFNEEKDLGFDDFVDFLKEVELDDFADLFKTFKVDVYFDVDKKNELARIEFDLMNIVSNDIVTDKIQDLFDEQIPENDVDIKTMFEYVKHFEIGVNISKLNTLEAIDIPNDAKNGFELKFLNAPFEPSELTEVMLGTPFPVSIKEAYGSQWFSFTVPNNKQVKIGYGSYFIPETYLYDSNFNYVSNYYDYSDYDTYTLSAGTYYLEVYSDTIGSFAITIN